MAIRFFKIKIDSVKRETSDSVSICFDIPEEFSERFKYEAGQYITVKVPIDDDDNRRAYSISISPNETLGKITITIKQIENGKVSVYLCNEAKSGDYLEIMPPLGNFTLSSGSNNSGYVFYAGGSGITPIISMLKTALINEPDKRAVLFYVSRTYQSIIFREELIELKSKFNDRLEIVWALTQYDENWTGHKGRFNTINLSVLLKKHCSEFFREAEHYLCGPAGMMKEVLNVLELLGVPKQQTFKESFALPAANELSKNGSKSGIALLPRNIDVKLYGETHKLTVEPQDTVVSALQKIGAMPPFSCQIGACSTCRAKSQPVGSFIMDVCEALTDEEIAAGFILACQAHPIEDNCFVDFDYI